MMRRFIKWMPRKVAQVPGTLIHVGEEKTEEVKITLTAYDQEQLEEKEVESVEECLPDPQVKRVTWINLDGVHDVAHIEKVGQVFGIHSLVLEDIVNTEHRLKLEEFEDYLFVVLKMLTYDRQENQIKAEHIGLILGADYVLSFQEREGDVFDPVRERLRNGKGRIRKSGADYLFYALLDAVVDHYFLVLEGLGANIEGIEDDMVDNPRPEALEIIHELKREMIFLRRAVWPLREVVNGLLRSESRLIHKGIAPFLRDVYDHTIHVIEVGETYRDMVSGMQDLYLSSISNKMNEVMKVLTIIATIFIPLTFIAGIYGMNFEFMPELKWKYAYFGVWLVIFALGAAMVVYFKRKKWL